MNTKMQQDELGKIKERHRKWLYDEVGGERADLSGVDLSDTNLSDTNLSGAYLRGADLSDTNLSGANLSSANLYDADLCDADLRSAGLRSADLRSASLSGAYLRGADLYDADLSGANLHGAYLRGANLRYANLRDADIRWIAAGNGRELVTLQTKKYNQIVYTADTMAISCKQFLLSEWWEFDDDQIAQMDVGALEWWKVHKQLLQALIAANPATPHGGVKANNEKT